MENQVSEFGSDGVFIVATDLKFISDDFFGDNRVNERLTIRTEFGQISERLDYDEAVFINATFRDQTGLTTGNAVVWSHMYYDIPKKLNHKVGTRNYFENYHSLVSPRMDTLAAANSYEVYRDPTGNNEWIWEPIDAMGFSTIMDHNIDTLNTSIYMELWYNQSKEEYDSSEADDAIWDRMNITMSQMQMLYKVERDSLVFSLGMTDMDMIMNENVEKEMMKAMYLSLGVDNPFTGSFANFVNRITAAAASTWTHGQLAIPSNHKVELKIDHNDELSSSFCENTEVATSWNEDFDYSCVQYFGPKPNWMFSLKNKNPPEPTSAPSAVPSTSRPTSFPTLAIQTSVDIDITQDLRASGLNSYKFRFPDVELAFKMAVSNVTGEFVKPTDINITEVQNIIKYTRRRLGQSSIRSGPDYEVESIDLDHRRLQDVMGVRVDYTIAIVLEELVSAGLGSSATDAISMMATTIGNATDVSGAGAVSTFQTALLRAATTLGSTNSTNLFWNVTLASPVVSNIVSVTSTSSRPSSMPSLMPSSSPSLDNLAGDDAGGGGGDGGGSGLAVPIGGAIAVIIVGLAAFCAYKKNQKSSKKKVTDTNAIKSVVPVDTDS
jgi:hypothetical protein